MLEMHLKQQVFTYSPYRLFTNNNEKTKKKKNIKETRDSSYTYQNKLGKARF